MSVDYPSREPSRCEPESPGKALSTLWKTTAHERHVKDMQNWSLGRRFAQTWKTSTYKWQTAPWMRMNSPGRICKKRTIPRDKTQGTAIVKGWAEKKKQPRSCEKQVDPPNSKARIYSVKFHTFLSSYFLHWLSPLPPYLNKKFQVLDHEVFERKGLEALFDFPSLTPRIRPVTHIFVGQTWLNRENRKISGLSRQRAHGTPGTWGCLQLRPEQHRTWRDQKQKGAGGLYTLLVGM